MVHIWFRTGFSLGKQKAWACEPMAIQKIQDEFQKVYDVSHWLRISHYVFVSYGFLVSFDDKNIIWRPVHCMHWLLLAMREQLWSEWRFDCNVGPIIQWLPFKIIILDGNKDKSDIMKLSYVNNIKNKNEICNEKDEDEIDKSITEW